MEQKAIDFIDNPQKWPCWPYLPVKRYKSDRPGELPEVGIIVAIAGIQYNVIKGVNLFDKEMAMKVADHIAGREQLPEEKFVDAESVVLAGWTVD